MITYVPDYYEKFRCIGSDCRDNCCIGWEIDIDSKTLQKYNSLSGAMGDELRANITVSEDGSDCFALRENDRCPFLNEQGLCRLILWGGEDMLCEICSLHPRFREWFGGRCEMGIGLCCEEAARIIISETAPFGLHTLSSSDESCEELTETQKKLLYIREELFAMINSAESVSALDKSLLEHSAEAEYELTGNTPEAVCIDFSEEYAEKVLSLVRSLEPLNDDWSRLAERLYAKAISTDSHDLAAHKNILSYFLFRYFMKSDSDGEIFLKSALAVFTAQVIQLISECTGMTLADSACIWSKETEYSAENLDAVYDFLYNEHYA